MQNRYSPPMAWLKELVKKLLGEIYFVKVDAFGIVMKNTINVAVGMGRML